LLLVGFGGAVFDLEICSDRVSKVSEGGHERRTFRRRWIDEGIQNEISQPPDPALPLTESPGRRQCERARYNCHEKTSTQGR